MNNVGLSYMKHEINSARHEVLLSSELITMHAQHAVKVYVH